MRYRARRADLFDEDDVKDILDLHRVTFEPSDPLPDMTYGTWWLYYPEGEHDPVAFCGICQSSYGPDYGYLKRAGVRMDHWGHGLQRRMIKLREKQARREGWHAVITDTTDNLVSSNNLIKAGYRLFKPDVPWGLKCSLYWRKPLTAV